MHKLFAIVCVTLMVRTVYTAVGKLRPVDKPEEFASQKGCYIPELKRVLPYNVGYSPQDGKSCMQYLCQSDGFTQIFTCGAQGVGPGCRIVPGDLRKPYPDCCDTVDCDPLPTTDDCQTSSQEDEPLFDSASA